ncbi:ABC transporter ATP-binding protein [Pseudopelagicola sp. nBUS_20]|uniref:ABC transporter ATP-binding protein n=1 Tax=Pseudopelagicola sp. nBUS_20 TaxID=3395317 RepID=UPI003EB928BE
MTLLLSTQKLSKNFDGLQAVSDVNFDLPKGQIRALIGPNGAGKTTFVSMLCGRLRQSSGKVSFEGKDISDLAAHVRINLGMAYTFQITSVFASLSVWENVALAARRASLNSNVEKVVMDSLEKVGIAGKTAQAAGDLSYGHQRLLEIAMGIAQSPLLLILDEPTQGLTDLEIANFIELVRSLSASTTILLIEHNMSVVMEVAELITVFDFGKILAEGTPDQIRANAEVQAAYLGTSNA